jgi:xanthine/CO dehydrogenase XdhC/CoxF family maturation factor
MRELQIILEAWHELQKQGDKAALATVVKVEGSAYRRAGARMLIAADGRTWGGVSGGCLEADVVLQAQTVMQKNCPATICYDTRDEADIFFGLGMGCNGVIQIFIEPLSHDSPLMNFFADFLQRRETMTLTTIFRLQNPNFPIGTRWFDDAPQEIFTGEVEAFVEVLQPAPTLMIFGAGHDALPVVTGAKALGWHLILADHRPHCLTAQNFPEADEMWLGSTPEILEKISINERTGVLLMTHNYLHDREILPFVLASKAPYVGMVSSQQRTEKLLHDLEKQSAPLTSAQKAKLHAPVGLDIGAQTPAEIALAILAEIQAVFAGRHGGFLRDQNFTACL